MVKAKFEAKEVDNIAELKTISAMQARRRKQADAAIEKKEKSDKDKKNNRIALLIVFPALILFAIILFSEKANKDAPMVDAFDDMDALYLCQYTIKRLARDPEKAKVPYVKGRTVSGEYYFSWGSSTKMARMRNGLGFEVAVSASCVVDGISEKITSLTVNGKTIR